jgi:cyclase
MAVDAARLGYVRMIAVLLLRGSGFVKTVRFGAPNYLGDAFNILRIFNEKGVDELAILDIDASREGRGPRFEVLRELADECFMPVAYGGGIRTVEDCRRLFKAGFEKAIVNTALIERPTLATEIALEFGSQALVGSIDVRRSWMSGAPRVVTRCGRRATTLDPVRHARELAQRGVGELLINSIDRDGTMTGFDHALVQSVAGAVDIPVIACGGARGLGDLVEVVLKTDAAAVAAGSMFVYYGRHRAVLINPPSQEEFLAALHGEAAAMAEAGA